MDDKIQIFLKIIGRVQRMARILTGTIPSMLLNVVAGWITLCLCIGMSEGIILGIWPAIKFVNRIFCTSKCSHLPALELSVYHTILYCKLSFFNRTIRHWIQQSFPPPVADISTFKSDENNLQRFPKLHTRNVVISRPAIQTEFFQKNPPVYVCFYTGVLET